MKELYEKVYIKSEDDLPKDKVNLFFFSEKDGEGFNIIVNPLDSGCLTNLLTFDWYLQPITESQPKDECEYCNEPIPCNLECEPKDETSLSPEQSVILPTDEEIENQFPISKSNSMGGTAYNICLTERISEQKGKIFGAKWLRSQINVVDLREELIKFGKWFNQRGEPMIKPTIDEYLKSKKQ